VAVEGATKKKQNSKKKSQSFPPWPHCPHTTIIIGIKRRRQKNQEEERTLESKTKKLSDPILHGADGPHKNQQNQSLLDSPKV
jgi:hypothetical protein